MDHCRFGWRLFVLITLSLFFMGCKDQPETNENNGGESRVTEEQPVLGGVYHVPLLNNPATLDPAYVQDEYGTAVVQQIFDGLVRFDPYLLILPALAETWQVEENGKRYRFFLRENARFHNGQPVTAGDVVFSISRLLRTEPSPAIIPHLMKIAGAEAYRNGTSETVQGLQAESDRIVTVHLEEPHAPLLTALGMYQAKIVPKAEVIRLGDGFGRNPVGSGPFQFTAWQTDKQIRLEQFPDYFLGSPYLDGVVYTIYPGGETDLILSDFRQGELDEMSVSGNVREELALQEDVQWFHRPALSLMFYGIRVTQPFLNNPELRKALALSIDRERLIRQVYRGELDAAGTVLPPGMPGFTRQNALQTDGPEAARKVISEILGKEHDADFSVEIVSASQSAFAQAELKFVQDAWADLGIAVKAKYITDWSEFEAYLKSDAIQIYRYAWFADMPDPDSFLYSLFASDSPANFMGFRNEDVDRMLLAARRESDPGRRTEMYRDIEARVMNAAPIIPLVYLSVDRVYQPNVQGAQPSALGAAYMPLHHVWLKKDGSTP